MEMKRQKSTILPVWVGIVVAMSFGFGTAREAAAVNACQADDVCAPGANPCVISSSYTINEGCTFDFGDRDVLLQANKTLTLAGCSQPVTFLARSFTTESGSTINGKNAGPDCGATVVFDLTGDFVHAGTFNMRASLSPGTIEVTAGGSILSTGKWFANATNTAGDGGTIQLDAGGDISLDRDSTIDLHGNGQGKGGDCFITAGGTITLDQKIDASGGNFGGGSITIEAGGDIVAASTRAVTLNTSATGSGDGGDIDISAGGAVTLGPTKSISLDLHGGGSSGGSGGDLFIEAETDVFLDGPVTAQGGDGGGDGGWIDLSARTGNLTVTQPLKAFGTTDGDGGDVTLWAGGDLTISGKINASAPGESSSGGSADLSTGRKMTLAAGIDVSAWDGGEVFLESGGDLVVGTTQAVTLDASGSGDGDGGWIDITVGGSATFGESVNVTISVAGGAGFEGWAGWGGDLTIDVAGNLYLGAAVEAQGSAASESGGWGGTVSLAAFGGDVTIANTINAFGSGPEGVGGSFSLLSGGSFSIEAQIDLSGKGTNSEGGDAFMKSGGSATINARVNASGNSWGLGLLQIEAEDDVYIYADLTCMGGGDVHGYGGEIDISARRGNVIVAAVVQATGSNPDADGEINVTACQVEISPDGELVRPEGRSTNTIILRETGRMEGAMASGRANVFYYREQPPIITGTVTPPPTLIRNPNLCTCADSDNDGAGDNCDNCPDDANPDQTDTDGDGLGDACDPCPDDPDNDADGDGVCGGIDNCPGDANPDQADADGDGAGDACDACPADPANDADGDGVCGDTDNCPDDANPDQADADGDGAGDACDACPADPANDADGDGVCGDTDNCPEDANPDQTDADGDGFGAACDCADDDGEIHPGAEEVCDGADNDCNGSTDEGFDEDGDGFTTCGGDCADDDPQVNPDATELCDDGIDNDCNGATDTEDEICPTPPCLATGRIVASGEHHAPAFAFLLLFLPLTWLQWVRRSLHAPRHGGR